MARLEVEINGLWTVQGLISILGYFDKAYLAAAAVQSRIQARRTSLPGGPLSSTPDDALEEVRVFDLGGEGLRIKTIHYGSPGVIALVGAVVALKPLADIVNRWREISLARTVANQRYEVDMEALRQQRRRDERADALRGRELNLKYERDMREFDLRQRALLRETIEQLPPAQRTAANAKLVDLMFSSVESIAKDGRIGEIRMLPESDEAA